MEIEVHNTSKVITIARPFFYSQYLNYFPLLSIAVIWLQTLMDEHYDFGDARE
jgi:hypothetical protein